jgi:hypothetical protein
MVDKYYLKGTLNRRERNYFRNRYGFRMSYPSVDKNFDIVMEANLSLVRVTDLKRELTPNLRLEKDEGHLEFVERKIREQDKITDSEIVPNEIIQPIKDDMLRSDKKEQIRENMIRVEVPQHDRKLKSGKVITIKAHTKWKPKK